MSTRLHLSDKHIGAELRRLIRNRANGICEYCRSQERFSPQRFSVEHIKPFSSVDVGLTPFGRATVDAMRMKRVELVNLRDVLYAAQKHPPTEPDQK